MRVVPLGFQSVAEAEAFDIQKLDLGSTCYVDALDAFFDYRESTDTPNGTTVLSCNGINGVRWLIRSGSGAGAGISIPSNTVQALTSGNDAHDGVTAPVKTLSRAVFLIQQMHGGTILTEDFIWASPTLGGGLNLRGSSDTGIGGPTWLDIAYPMKITFNGNPEPGPQAWGAGYIAPGGGAGEFIEPAVQMAGLGAGLIWENAQFWTQSTGNFPTVRAGLSSPLAAWDAGTVYNLDASVTYLGKPYDCIISGTTPGDAPSTHPLQWRISRSNLINGDLLGSAYTANILFNKCQFVRIREDLGPALDLGVSFWNYYQNCMFYHTAGSAVDPVYNASVRMMDTARGAAYLQFFTECQQVGMGFYGTGDTSGVINGMSIENAASPQLQLEQDPDLGRGGLSRWDVFNMDVNDSPPLISETRSILNNALGIVYATRCAVGHGRVIENEPTSIGSPMTDRFTYGTSGPTLLKQHDSARRSYMSGSSKYPNVAWQAPTGATLMAAPDGTMTAFAAGPVSHTLFDGSTAPQTLVDGDRVIFGFWNRFDTGGDSSGNFVSNSGAGNITIFWGGFTPLCNQTLTLTPGEALRNLPDVPSSNGQWAWQWGWLKVITKGTGAITISANTSTTGALWRPSVQIIPASDTLITDSEVAYLAMHSPGPANYRKFGAPDTILSPTAGTVPFWPGQKLAFLDATLGVWKYLDIDNGAVRVT
jgi:hypothetical protein